nr:hypothetical protein [uncultured archaeon]
MIVEWIILAGLLLFGAGFLYLFKTGVTVYNTFGWRTPRTFFTGAVPIVVGWILVFGGVAAYFVQSLA